MGIYDDMLTLQKTSPVTASESPKTVESVVETPIQPKSKKVSVKVAIRPQNEPKPIAMTELPVFKKRNITRGSFEVFQDQLHVLRQVSLTAKLTGDDLSISEMVREAIDEYIHRKDLHP